MGHVHGHSNSLAEFSYLDRLVPVLLDEAELFEFEEKEEFEFDVEVDVESSESLLLDDRVHICKWQKHHYMYCACVAQYTGALTHLLSSENSVDDPPLDWLEESSLSLSEVSVVPDRDELLNHAHPSVRYMPSRVKVRLSPPKRGPADSRLSSHKGRGSHGSIHHLVPVEDELLDVPVEIEVSDPPVDVLYVDVLTLLKVDSVSESERESSSSSLRVASLSLKSLDKSLPRQRHAQH